jgi:hypothetical protein
MGVPLGGVQVVEVRKTSAIIRWTDGASNGRPISRYLISGRTNWNNTWINITHGKFICHELLLHSINMSLNLICPQKWTN